MSNLAADPCVRPSASTIKGMAAGILDEKFEVGNSLAIAGRLRRYTARSPEVGKVRHLSAEYGKLRHRLQRPRPISANKHL
jgi:hypothetical protein